MSPTCSHLVLYETLLLPHFGNSSPNPAVLVAIWGQFVGLPVPQTDLMKSISPLWVWIRTHI